MVFKEYESVALDTCRRVENGTTKTEQHSGQQPMLRDAMNDVANTVEYMLECRNKKDK